MFMFLSNWEQSMTLHVVMFPGSLWFENVWKLKLLRFFRCNSRSKHLWTCQKVLSNYCCVVFTSQREYATPNHLWEVAKTRRLLWVPSWVQLLRDGKFLVQQWGESECCFAISLIWWPVCACVWQLFFGVKVATSDTHTFMISSSHPVIHLCINQWIHFDLFQCTSIICVIFIYIYFYTHIWLSRCVSHLFLALFSAMPSRIQPLPLTQLLAFQVG